jgi:hypothetical protein
MYLEVPLCFQRAINFRDKLGGNSGAERRLAVLDEERKCGSFTPWQQGFTPKEHREMLDREQRERHEADLRQAVWDREDKRDDGLRKYQVETRKLQERLHARELMIFGLGVTFALIVGAIVAAIIEGAVSAGWEPSWWPF